MADSEALDLERLRQLLEERDAARREPGKGAEPHAERITRALLGQPPPELSCADVEEALPAFVEAELRGAGPTRLYPAIARHLSACPHCGALYAELLTNEMEPASETLPFPAWAPLARRLWLAQAADFLERITAELLRRLYPEHATEALGKLRRAVEGYLEQVANMGEVMVAARGPAAGYLAGDWTPAVELMSATWAAVQRLETTVPPGQLSALRESGRLAEVAEPVVHDAARDAGLSPSRASTFAREFIHLLEEPQNQPPPWRPGE